MKSSNVYVYAFTCLIILVIICFFGIKPSSKVTSRDIRIRLDFIGIYLSNAPEAREAIFRKLPHDTILDASVMAELYKNDGVRLLDPILNQLDSFNSLEYVDGYRHAWRMKVTSVAISIWSMGEDGADQIGGGDDICITVPR